MVYGSGFRVLGLRGWGAVCRELYVLLLEVPQENRYLRGTGYVQRVGWRKGSVGFRPKGAYAHVEALNPKP